MTETPTLISLTEDMHAELDMLADASGGRITISDRTGSILYRSTRETPEDTPATSRPFRIEGEPVGTIDVRSARPETTVALVNAILNDSYRRGLVASTYRETLSDNYEELMERNRQLSELASSLEVKVEERTRELADTQMQLVREEKVAAIGRLAAGVAHELNTPLACIRSNLHALAEGRCPTEERNEIIQESVEMTDRAAQIVRDLRDFAHVDDVGSTEVDVNQEIEHCLARLEIGRGLEILREYGQIPRIVVDGRHLNVAILHLLENACDAMTTGGILRIETSADPERVTVRIHDTGPGIPPGIIGRVFDPFFTTKEVGRGKGLGLTVARNVARSLGGDVILTCGESGGTVASLSIAIRNVEKKP